MKEYNWVALLLLSFAIVLMFQCFLLDDRDLEMKRKYFKKKVYWGLVFVIYGALLLSGLMHEYQGGREVLVGRVFVIWNEMMENYNMTLLGLLGMGMSGGWIVREKVLGRLYWSNKI